MTEIFTLEQAQASKKFIFSGEVQHKAVGDSLIMSGYVSTKQPDLGGDVCPPDSWNEFLPMYRSNPIYCYDHWLSRGERQGGEPPYPIGYVKNAFTDSEGLMLEDITLTTSVPFVRDVIANLIEAGVLRQQSVGFLAFEQKPGRDGLRYLTRNWCQEGSIVPLAMNPFGTDVSLKNLGLNMSIVDGFADFENVEAIVKAYQDGKLIVNKQFFIPDNGQSFSETPTNEHDKNKSMSNALQPDFTKVAPTVHKSDQYDPEGAAIAKPPKYDKNYAGISELIYAATSQDSEDSDKTFLFQIGEPTDKGFKYDFDMLATATAKVLGAKGGAKWSGGEKKLVLERLSEAYEVLGKRFPAFCRTQDEPISKMAAWKLEDIEYREVEFFNGEADIVKRTIAKVDISNVIAAIKSGGIEDLTEFEELQKYVSGSLSLTLTAYGWESEEVDFLVNITNMWNEFNKASRAAYEDYYFSFSYKGWFDGDIAKYAKVGCNEAGEQKAFEYEKSGNTFHPTDREVQIPENAVDLGDLDAHNRYQKMFELAEAKLQDLNSTVTMVKPENAEIIKRLKSFTIDDF